MAHFSGSFGDSRSRVGLRVGVICIAATIVDKSMPPRFSERLRFTSGLDELPLEIARLRSSEGVHLIVVLSHLGFPQDAKLAQSINGVDVVVSGHTHDRLERPARTGETLVIQSGCHGSFVGKLDLDVEDGRITAARHQLIPVDETVAADTEMEALVERAMAPHRSILTEIVGHTFVGLHRNTTLYSSMDDVLLPAIAQTANTEGVLEQVALRGAGPAGPRHCERSLEHHADKPAGLQR